MYILFSLLFSLSAFAQMGPHEGTYAGFAHMEGSKFRIPLRLEIAYSNEEGGVKARFFVRLSRGGFISNEYQAYFFQIDAFDMENPALNLEADGGSNANDVSLFDALVSADRSRISGNIQSNRAGLAKGNFDVIFVDPNQSAEANNRRIFSIFSDYPLAPTITGAYTSSCPDQHGLQIEAARIARFNRAEVASFGGYVLTGRITNEDSIGTDFFPGGQMVFKELSSLSGDLEFDFYRDTLLLNAAMGTLCQVGPSGLDCNGCKFTRITEGPSKLLMDALVQKDFPIATLPPEPAKLAYCNKELDISRKTLAADAEGEYEGKVFYSSLNKTRALSGQVRLSGRPNIDGSIGDRFVSLTMEKRFSRITPEGTIDRVFPYSLDRTKLDGPIRGKVLDGPFDDVAKINHWTKSKIAGVIYSKNFGELGEFVLYRKGIPSDIDFERLRLFGCLDGLYTETEAFEGLAPRRLVVRLSPDRTPMAQASFPFSLEGFFAFSLHGNEPIAQTEKSFFLPRIQGTAFDPYTSVALIQTDGNLVIFGRFDDDHALLHLAGNAYGRMALPFHEPRIFKKE